MATDQLIQGLRQKFEAVKEHRYKNAQIPLGDFLQSAFAMFHLKDPSLHHYRINYREREANLERVYQVKSLPSDSAMREGIDYIAPGDIQACFKVPLQTLGEEGIMNEYRVLGRYNCLLFDGTQHYCSCTTACEHCLTREHRNKKGEVTKITYHHQALAAVMAHHGHKEVFPVCCEAIVRQDGSTKNDCELNAGKRLIPLVRGLLPKEQHELLGVFDGLYPNGPFIRMLQEHEMRFVIGIQEGYVIIQTERLRAANALQEHSWLTTDGQRCVARWHNQLVLNGQNQDIEVNYFELEQFDTEGQRAYFNSWITDIAISKENIVELTLIGRSRWKIENETFNTLKNQGYHLEHNYGHGEKYLATNFMLLTFLAFCVDQIAQKLDQAFDKALKYCKTKKKLWEKIRQVFDLLPCKSMNVIYRFIAKDIQVDFPLLE